MAKYLADLDDRLKEIAVESHFFSNPRISSCRCLNMELKFFSSEVVYVGNVSDLPPDPTFTVTINLLLLGDKEIPQIYHCRSGVNWIICDPEKSDTVRLINKVEEFFQEDIQLASYTEEILGAISEQESLHEMLEITYRYIGNPLRVIDAAHNLVASYWGDSSLDEPQWVEYEKGKLFSQKFTDVCNADFAFRHHMLSSSEPYIMDYPDIFKHRQRTLRIRQKGMNIAFASELEYNRPFNDFTSQILQMFGKSAGIKLSNDAHFFCSSDSPASELLLHVLKSVQPNPLKIQQLMNSAGLNFRKYLYLVYITDGDLFDSKEKMIYIRNIMDRFFVGCLTQMVDGKVIILLDSDQCRKSPILENLLPEFVNTLRVNKIYAGISRCFRQITQASQALEQAKKAFFYARQNGADGPLFYYEDYTMEDFVQILLEKRPLEMLLDPGLLEVIEYDKERHTSLVQTLTCYLDNQMNLQSVSQKLHIHVNTLKYRIQKIQNIALLDFTEVDSLLRLKISLIALQYPNSKTQTGNNLTSNKRIDGETRLKKRKYPN